MSRVLYQAELLRHFNQKVYFVKFYPIIKSEKIKYFSFKQD